LLIIGAAFTAYMFIAGVAAISAYFNEKPLRQMDLRGKAVHVFGWFNLIVFGFIGAMILFTVIGYIVIWSMTHLDQALSAASSLPLE